MPDLIIKPTATSGNKLILKDQAGGAVLTTADSGATFSGGNIGTVTAGAINGGSIGSAVTGFAGIKEIDHWRLTQDFSGSKNTIDANLERVDDAVFSKIGTGMTQSSGIFTFPSTGIWLVRANASWKSTSGDSDYAGLDIRASQAGSGGTFVLISETYTGITTTNHYANSICEAILDVTNTTNVVVKFGSGVNTSDTVTQGDTVRTETGFMFIRIGDT